MKTRTGFVSNSSSSSFIAYGARLNSEQIIDVLVVRIGEDKLVELSDYDNISDVRDAMSNEGYDGAMSQLVDKADVDFGIDEYSDEDGEWLVGIEMDPEYSLTKEMALNGIWKQEDFDKVDALFEGTSIKPKLSAGYGYY